MEEYDFLKDSIFRIGEVFAVNGREITIKVDCNKNLSHILYRGKLIKNVSVGSYIKIKKGFNRLVAKVECEMLRENRSIEDYHSQKETLARHLIVKVIGYFDGEKYCKGIKEVPLIGDVCFLLDNDEFSLIHKFAGVNEPSINIGHLLSDENIPIEISVDKLFASHIGIFGNTGSGKSHSLAKIYQELFSQMQSYENFRGNARFVIFDFNGEYSGDETITSNKTVYRICTGNQSGNKLPLREADLYRPELLSIMCSASEKTQQPFIKRALRLLTLIDSKEKPEKYVRKILKTKVYETLTMSDRVKSKLLIDYLEQILPHSVDSDGFPQSLQKQLGWHGKNNCFYFSHGGRIHYLNSEEEFAMIKHTELHRAAAEYEIPEESLNKIIAVLYIQLIDDVLSNRATNEHIAPVINKLRSFQRDFDKVFEFTNKDIWDGKNIIVIDLNKSNISVKKLIPMLLSYRLYEEKKKVRNNTSYLNIIIDEAHNVLSYESLRESESFKDFRLETFEEIIKEGRKFGVFLTLSSQRPSDISPTIVSQLHNYFIHRLVNNKDIEMIEKAVSYIDKLSLESLPILPVGACILSGIIADLPIILQVDALPISQQPKSQTIRLTDAWMGCNVDSCVENESQVQISDFDELDDVDKDLWDEEL